MSTYIFITGYLHQQIGRYTGDRQAYAKSWSVDFWGQPLTTQTGNFTSGVSHMKMALPLTRWHANCAILEIISTVTIQVRVKPCVHTTDKTLRSSRTRLSHKHSQGHVINLNQDAPLDIIRFTMWRRFKGWTCLGMRCSLSQVEILTGVLMAPGQQHRWIRRTICDLSQGAECGKTVIIFRICDFNTSFDTPYYFLLF